MFKKLTLFCFAFATMTCYAQKTKIPITGIDAIKLGESISKVNNYGFPFIAVTKFHLSDSVYLGNAFNPKQPLFVNKAKAAETRIEDIYVDSGKTFCPDVAVFITNSFVFKQLKHSITATLALTYYKNVLIEIRIIDSAQYIKDNYSFGIGRYGTNFSKTFNAAKSYLAERENATHPSWKTKTAIATIGKQLSDDNFLESIFWQNSNNSFSYNYCSAPLRFWANKFLPTHGWGCVEGVMIIKNEKAYKAMTDCSDKTISLCKEDNSYKTPL
ncbi:hypothetical protein [Sediminibacterium sp.]|uniref:hypothetical protein n=1 Tax=Sediminibacterium sp. TaxID=1917865 RepID=UPI003F710C9A